MVTKAALLKAAKQIVAAAAKPTTKRKKNPAPRIGTAKPKRRSQATGKAPTKRLVTRRKANAKKGYFPNPAEVVKAHKTAYTPSDKKYIVQTRKTATAKWVNVAEFWGPTHAKEYAERMGECGVYARVMVKD